MPRKKKKGREKTHSTLIIKGRISESQNLKTKEDNPTICSGVRCTCYYYYYYYYYYYFVFWPFLGPLLQHMEVPRLGVQSELQPPAYGGATATWASKPCLQPPLQLMATPDP